MLSHSSTSARACHSRLLSHYRASVGRLSFLLAFSFSHICKALVPLAFSFPEACSPASTQWSSLWTYERKQTQMSTVSSCRRHPAGRWSGSCTAGRRSESCTVFKGSYSRTPGRGRDSFTAGRRSDWGTAARWSDSWTIGRWSGPYSGLGVTPVLQEGGLTPALRVRQLNHS